ncbi:phage portal protein [Aeromonas veronii]|uniref:phage portal protein n=1 Tax=Aeromonas veronii TaxID=654 RepID=UPI003D1AEDA9
MALNKKSIGFNGLSINQVISGSGHPINYQTAMNDPTVAACVRIISQTLSTLPIKLYKQYRVAGCGKEWVEDTSSLMAHTLTNKPNPRQTTNELIEQMTAQLVLFSESFAHVKYDANGRVLSITPFNSPKQVQVIEAGDALIYKAITNDNKSISPSMAEILHLRDTSLNTFAAIDKIINAKSSLGLSAAATHNAESYYKQGPRVGGFIETPNNLSNEEYHRLGGVLESKYSGNGAAHGIGLLEGGAKFSANEYTLKNAQVLEARNASIREIAAIFGVPTELLGIATGIGRDTNRFFYNSCLQALIIKFESRLTALLPRGYAVKFDTSEFLRGEVKEAATVAKELFTTGVIGLNEARIRVGHQPIHKEDIFAVDTNNLTFGTITDFCKPKPEEVKPNEDESSNQVIPSE